MVFEKKKRRKRKHNKKQTKNNYKNRTEKWKRAKCWISKKILWYSDISWWPVDFHQTELVLIYWIILMLAYAWKVSIHYIPHLDRIHDIQLIREFNVIQTKSCKGKEKCVRLEIDHNFGREINASFVGNTNTTSKRKE